MSGQAAQMNQAGGSGVGVAAAHGMPQHQPMQDGVGLGGIDAQFVKLRNSMREKIFEYIGRKKSSPEWRRRLPELARRLEEILFRKFSNKNDYYNMMKGPIEPQLHFAIKILSAHNQQYQQKSRPIASSSGYGMMIPTPGMTQGSSGSARLPYVTDNCALSSPASGIVAQSANIASRGSTSHISSSDAVDLKKELSQMNKALKDLYLAGLGDLYETYIQRGKGNPVPTEGPIQVPEEVNFKLILERSLDSVQIKKLPSLEESTPMYKREILSLINSKEWMPGQKLQL